ncbi:hypothetical protein G3573_21420, partial [Caulobacter sp. 17J65-9]|nr:hypothetical protein [Caulobacter sp. 17J65-9]
MERRLKLLAAAGAAGLMLGAARAPAPAQPDPFDPVQQAQAMCGPGRGGGSAMRARL